MGKIPIRSTLRRDDSRLACYFKFVLWMLLSSFVFYRRHDSVLQPVFLP